VTEPRQNWRKLSKLTVNIDEETLSFAKIDAIPAVNIDNDEAGEAHKLSISFDVCPPTWIFFIVLIWQILRHNVQLMKFYRSAQTALKIRRSFSALFCSHLLHLLLPLLPILTSALGRRANWFFQDALIKADFISSFRAYNFAFICPSRCQKFAVIIFTRISTVDWCLRLLSLPSILTSAVGRYELDYLKWFNPRKLCTAGKRYKSASKWYINRASSAFTVLEIRQFTQLILADLPQKLKQKCRFFWAWNFVFRAFGTIFCPADRRWKYL